MYIALLIFMGLRIVKTSHNNKKKSMFFSVYNMFGCSSEPFTEVNIKPMLLYRNTKYFILHYAVFRSQVFYSNAVFIL